jgi:hypothetical protein
MSAGEKKRVKVLLVVLAVTAVVWYLALFRDPAAASSPLTNPAAPSGAPARPAQVPGGESVIRVDLLENIDSGSSNAGNTNLFQYRARTEPQRPPASPPPQVFTTPVVTRSPQIVPVNTAPALAPFKQFRYEAVVKRASTGRLTAYLSDGSSFPAFEASEGEVILGQYKITRLTESMVEIEDMFQKRRQSFPKVTQ